MAVATALRVPTLVVCPKIAISQWHQVASYFEDTLSVIGHEQLRNTSPFGNWQHPLPPDKNARESYQCQTCQCKINFQNFQPCPYHPAGIHCVQTKKKTHRYGRFTFHPAIKFLIVDECHKFNALDSLNADILIAARRQRIPTLALSATPGSSPLHFRALGYLLGLHNLEDFEGWARRYGVKRDPAFHGLVWPVSEAKQAEVMADIHSQIFPSRGVRVRTSDIENFPAVEVTAEFYDLEGAGKIDEAYREMAASLATLAERQKMDVAPESAITIQLRAQQKAELCKVPLFVELAEKYIAAGISVGIFANFQATIDELAARLKTDAIIDGRHTGARRERTINSFQTNSSPIILVQNAAGGLALSLQDLHGGHPRGGLVSAGFSAVVLRQLLGRFPRDGAQSASFYRVIFAGEVERKIQRALRGKLRNLDSLLDSDLIPT
jgi:superfamily II DNA or RNA helicase